MSFGPQQENSKNVDLRRLAPKVLSGKKVFHFSYVIELIHHLDATCKSCDKLVELELKISFISFMQKILKRSAYPFSETAYIIKSII
jgi:hypothetical protein